MAFSNLNIRFLEIQQLRRTVAACLNVEYSFLFYNIYLSSAASVFVSIADTLFNIETGIERNESFSGFKLSSTISNYVYREQKEIKHYFLNNCGMSDKNYWALVLKVT